MIMHSGKERCYSELSKLETFEERFRYLQLSGSVGYETFGPERYANQAFYRSPEWKRVRKTVIARDMGRDLGIKGRELSYGLHIHHMNPIDFSDISERSDYLMNPEYLICVSEETHRAIHYGSEENLIKDPIDRKPGDTCPWKTPGKAW